jgi:hypothetical protein
MTIILVLNNNPAPQLDIPELNKRVPPFLAWLSEANAGKVRNVSKGFREGLIRTSLKLTRLEKTPYADSLRENLFQIFDATDVYCETGQISFDEFEQERRNLHKGKEHRSFIQASSFSTDEVLGMAEQYFTVSLRVLESFVAIKHRSTLISKCLAALAMIMKV